MAGFVYFVQGATADGQPGPLIKIGFTSGDVDQRCRSLQSGSPLKLKVIAVIPARKKKEGVLHRRFLHLRHHGEWFEAGEDLLAYIATHAQPWPDAETRQRMERRGWPWEPWKPRNAEDEKWLGPSIIKAIEDRRLIELEALLVKIAIKEARAAARFKRNTPLSPPSP